MFTSISVTSGVSPEVGHVSVDIPVIHYVHDGRLDPQLHVGDVGHHAGVRVNRASGCHLHCTDTPGPCLSPPLYGHTGPPSVTSTVRTHRTPDCHLHCTDTPDPALSVTSTVQTHRNSDCHLHCTDTPDPCLSPPLYGHTGPLSVTSTVQTGPPSVTSTVQTPFKFIIDIAYFYLIFIHNILIFLYHKLYFYS